MVIAESMGLSTYVLSGVLLIGVGKAANLKYESWWIERSRGLWK